MHIVQYISILARILIYTPIVAFMHGANSLAPLYSPAADETIIWDRLESLHKFTAIIKSF